ncbi:PIN domain-containing protein [Mangrovibacterium marinum]|uniref:Putative nucleic acid-binding protein n=1 Tax=Mangrovibacterium marinum TaxID=1639118 RepID=A0A2T5C1T5_9BACT|nr:PIN domain-containing protein [Mangrovibacterium marinum]PTN08659.1 putative nucleic acid-binding protein [Mangrovibacterium marinum]
MAGRYSLSRVNSISGRPVFFDANVLIYIFWPTGLYRWESNYSAVFGQLLRQSNELYVDFLVISEVINRIHRVEYEKYLAISGANKATLNYKAYRDSEEGERALADIYLIVETSILSCFTVVGKMFTEADILSFLKVEQLDIMDKAILSICQENSFVLCTNDRDYKSSDIDILTSNPAILNHA